MTGLDQDMMQRTLACKDYRDSQKNLVVSSLLQTVVIAGFLCLGSLLYQFAAAHGISETGDSLFPAVATGGLLPAIVGVFFIVGLLISAYGAGGSALTSLTTSFTVDILNKASEVKVRKTVHLAMAVLMAVTIVVFNALNSTSAIDAVYKLASYTYGPILGLFAFGILTKKQVKDKYVPLVALLAPAICLVPRPPAQLRTLVRRLQVQLRTPPPQRRPHLPRPHPPHPLEQVRHKKGPTRWSRSFRSNREGIISSWFRRPSWRHPSWWRRT